MTPQHTDRALHAAQILWPAFLAAAVLEMVVFSWVDPEAMQWGGWQPDRQTTYSLTFLIFWASITVASLISHWMMKPLNSPEGQLDATEAAPAKRSSGRRATRTRQVHHHHA